MPSSVLANLTLGYELVWDRQRQATGVLLFVHSDDETKLDGAHVLDVIAQEWTPKSPQLVLLVQDCHLLEDVLAHARKDGPWIGIQESLLHDPAVSAQAQQAHARGVQLVWRGEPGKQPDLRQAGSFARRIAALSAGQALWALNAAKHDGARPSYNSQERMASPVRAGDIMEAVASRALVDHCLDAQHAWGVAGWPTDDVLHTYHGRPIQPGADVITRLVEATDADLALERIENILTDDPVLVHRFLRHANSAALGLRTGVDSLRHGLMVVGLSTFRRWLLAQLPNASRDADLKPVLGGMVLRARLMELLLDSSEEPELCNEVHLCGLLSQIDVLLGEPMAAALHHFPVPERVTGAIISRTGPYAPLLDIATALEHANMGNVAELCDNSSIDITHVNRVLLRILAQPMAPAGGRLGV
jgi:EAL and modified HD-GYP domain-containing signal transduction protein